MGEDYLFNIMTVIIIIILYLLGSQKNLRLQHFVGLIVNYSLGFAKRLNA